MFTDEKLMQFQIGIIAFWSILMFACVCSAAGINAAFDVFVHAVFYIGKGKRSRPYEHFKEAVTYFQQTVKGKVCVVFSCSICEQFLLMSQNFDFVLNGVKS